MLRECLSQLLSNESTNPIRTGPARFLPFGSVLQRPNLYILQALEHLIYINRLHAR
jgi:hypothetical protein